MDADSHIPASATTSMQETRDINFFIKKLLREIVTTFKCSWRFWFKKYLQKLVKF